MKFYNSHVKYKPELSEYFQMYSCQLNFAMFRASDELGISRQYLKQPNLIVRIIYQFHVYFNGRIKPI